MKKKVLPMLLPILVVFFFYSPDLFSQKKNFTYDQVFSFRGIRSGTPLPRITVWIDDNHYLESKRDDGRQIVMKVNAANGESSLYLDYEELNKKLPEGFTLQRSEARTEDLNHFIFRKENNLYYFNLTKEVFKQITGSESEEMNVTFSPDAKKIAYTREHDLYFADLTTGKETRLTYDATDRIYNGWASWVYYEEILGRGSRYRAFWWAPDSKKIAYLRFDDNPVPEFTLVSADGIHGEVEVTPYPKPGDPNPGVRLGVVHVETGKTVWMDTNEGEDRYIAWPFWTRNSDQLIYQYMPRDQDEITLFSADPSSGEKREIYTEKQKSWVEFFEDLYFFEDGSGFLLRSDLNGWRNLYYYDMSGKLISRVTDLDWRVTGISRVVEKTKTVFFTGTGGESTENHLFSINLNGKGLKKLTSESGSHRVSVSPGGKYFRDTYSNIDTPAKMVLYSGKGKFIRLLGDSRSEELDEYNLGKAELFTIPTSDGYELPAIWTLPPDFDESKKYPVIFAIYGGPNAQSVRNSSALSLRNHFFAQQGIITISVDHRGSGHLGKSGVELMHRCLGMWETHDYIEAAKWLRGKPFIDTTRIGITGSSYGGYMTLMALTAGADYFTHGQAGSAVTDWKLYDNVYTERYMDTPDQNPEGYEYGSVMTHIDKYKGFVLITHGDMDDNVHMQNIIQLIAKMQELNKDFELMIYPGGRHGWGGPQREHSTRESVQFWFRHFLGKELDE
ncbi:MAG: S9 family peptidase [Bacteroidales bacterium]|nr:MAG: S9 family peptidase [Bacteroidales bacterium]